jgi:prepilin-type N-terminal cleavage/methylation domain-containing protein
VITHRLKQYLHTHPNSHGLTLIECLVAIIMLGLVGSAIAPALVISVATRVQSQKAEQALELAQSEIDRVRLLVARGEANINTLPASVPFAGAYDADNKVALATGPVYGAPVANPTATQTRLASLNGHDFAVQVYRTPGRFAGSVPVTFHMGVRVYDRNAVVTGTGNLSSQPASLGMSGGLGERASRPLVALYTTVTPGERGDSLCQYIQYLDNAASVPVGCAN